MWAASVAQQAPIGGPVFGYEPVINRVEILRLSPGRPVTRRFPRETPDSSISKNS
jgi:hypothetical protein